MEKLFPKDFLKIRNFSHSNFQNLVHSCKLMLTNSTIYHRNFRKIHICFESSKLCNIVPAIMRNTAILPLVCFIYSRFQKISCKFFGKFFWWCETQKLFPNSPILINYSREQLSLIRRFIYPCLK